MRIAIIGYGFVGRSVHNSLSGMGHRISIQDPGKRFNAESDNYDAVFICVPTPTKESEQDSSIVTECVNEAISRFRAKLIVIKSTILPRTADIFCSKPGIIYVPEFLDQANPYEPTTKHIIGTDEVTNAEEYKKLFGEGHTYFITSPKTASMIKYVHNTHGALKVAFFNEIFDICQDESIDYREMSRILLGINNNVGEKYTRIAADGFRGFGGTCFPKDTAAFVWEYEAQTLNAALEANKKYTRP